MRGLRLSSITFVSMGGHKQWDEVLELRKHVRHLEHRDGGRWPAWDDIPGERVVTRANTRFGIYSFVDPCSWNSSACLEEKKGIKTCPSLGGGAEAAKRSEHEKVHWTLPFQAVPRLKSLLFHSAHDLDSCACNIVRPTGLKFKSRLLCFLTHFTPLSISLRSLVRGEKVLWAKYTILFSGLPLYPVLFTCD